MSVRFAHEEEYKKGLCCVRWRRERKVQKKGKKYLTKWGWSGNITKLSRETSVGTKKFVKTEKSC